MTALTPGTRVTTTYGPATVTEPPFKMASGWTVKVRLDDTTVTASGEIRIALTDLN